MLDTWKDTHVIKFKAADVEAHLAGFERSRLNFAKPECIRWTPRPTAAKGKR